MLEETQEAEEIIGRVAAFDIGKAALVCCIRVPGRGKGSGRLQEVQTYSTMTRSLLVLADRLGELGLMLLRLNRVLRGWAYYFRHGASSKTFAYLDALPGVG